MRLMELDISKSWYYRTSTLQNIKIEHIFLYNRNTFIFWKLKRIAGLTEYENKKIYLYNQSPSYYHNNYRKHNNMKCEFIENT